MELSRDEMRRELDAARRDHEQVMARQPGILRQVFDPASRTPGGVKAAVTGAPSRRQLFALGGVTVLGAAVVAACTPAPEETQIAQTGAAKPTSTTERVAEDVLANDLTTLRVAQSIEALAVQTYDEIASAADAELAEVLALFAEQHQEHATSLAAQIIDLGGEPYQQGADAWDQPNPVLAEALTEPLALATDNVGVLTLALQLENIAQQTYTFDVATLGSPELRAFVMSIGGIEARHVSVLLGFEQPNTPTVQAPFPFGKTLDAVKDGKAVETVGSGEQPSSVNTTEPVETTTTEAPTTTAKASTGSTR